MVWRIDDPQGNEAQKIKYDIVPFTFGKGLDLGCGPYKAFPHFIGVDNGHHWGTAGVDVSVETCADLSMFASDSMNFVFSSHLLEHMEDINKTLKEWFRVVKEGGYLVLYLPHADLYPRVGERGANPDHKHNLWPDTVIDAMKTVSTGFDLVLNEKRDHDRGPGVCGNEYSFLQVYKKTGGTFTHSWKLIKPKKTCAVVRYGGFGDMIQASSVLPGLKRQGFHITFFTTPAGHNILKENPYIDDFVIQGKDQVPNNELNNFWYVQRQRYTKFINLSESVEGTLLAMPGRALHAWPHSARHKALNRNYLEVTHDIAEVPFKPEAHFFPSAEEAKWAKDERGKMGKVVIAWSLSGSSVHKVWPYIDDVFNRIFSAFEHDNIEIVLMGDELCQTLEAGWETDPRVHCRSGIWSIRESLSFCQTSADLVVGPETGVLNAVGMESVPKIITLSHSSHENLTKHWRKTTVLDPLKTDCYPCHMLHYNFNFCHKDESTAAAVCQANISPERMFKAVRNEVLKILNQKKGGG